ncbi:MAG TPA: PQQ-binding-like beta-propeller repeat protein [Planctomycetaceae bacterium]|nr:PQQ-binding-like beta-propeller repeat protein [Planctomycetaceae bacterium]
MRLRIWPVLPFLVFMIGAQIALRTISNRTPALMQFILFGPVICVLAIGLWWLFASRAAWRDRILGLVSFGVLTAAAWFLSDPTMHSMVFVFLALPVVVLIATAALVVLSRVGSRTATLVTLLIAAVTFGYWDLIRCDGMSGDFQAEMHWRWNKSAEDQFLATLPADSTAKPASAEPLGKIVWPAFRGPQRNGTVPGIVLDAAWSTRPPKEIWRHKVGPGWSSFSIAGNRIFTQEQRGPQEVVVCYDAKTGAERWVHASPARFAETMGGVGPRATPTLAGDRLYALGATGLLDCLDPLTGALKWERDLKQDARPTPPMWGFASSPLVVGDRVVVHAGGPNDKGVVAYDTQTGKLCWSAPAGDHSYSSPQLATVAGREVILMLDNAGLSALDPVSGKADWTYEWKFNNYRAIQPLIVDPTGVLLGTGMGTGTRRIELKAAKADIEFAERWTSLDMKPDFNDYVAYRGYLYGLDHNILCCVDLATGKRKWKNGRYGNGQILLLPDAGQLLVLSEEGDLVLIRANPEKLDEVARQKVLDGKTWNHPALAGNRLYVRNAEEAACYELPLAGRSSEPPQKRDGGGQL